MLWCSVCCLFQGRCWRRWWSRCGQSWIIILHYRDLMYQRRVISVPQSFLMVNGKQCHIYVGSWLWAFVPNSAVVTGIVNVNSADNMMMLCGISALYIWLNWEMKCFCWRYRARVEKVTGNTVSVIYIDFGNVCWHAVIKYFCYVCILSLS